MNLFLAETAVETVTRWLGTELYHNSILLWAIVLIACVVTIPVALAVRAVVASRLRKITSRTTSRIDDVLVECLESVRRWFFVIAVIYLGAQWLVLPEGAERLLRIVFVSGAAVQMLLISRLLVDFFIHATFKAGSIGADHSDATLRSASGIIRTLVLGAVGTVVLLLALDNMGVAVTPLITGLGVGGVAVALASQSILSDLFGSLIILFDKPFLVGDFIIVGDKMGTVEHIGIKTTRVRALSGEELVMANSDLLGSRIQNYKRMQERRIVFTLGIVYETPLELVKRVPGIIREVVTANAQARLDRAHFKGFGAYSLDFEAVYFVTVPDYNLYMDIQQAINFELFRRFAEEGIEFAYPTQLVIRRDEAKQGQEEAVQARAG